MPADDVDNVLTERGREGGEHRAAHVGQRVDQLPLQEGHQGAQGGQEGPAELGQTGGGGNELVVTRGVSR